MTTHSSILAWKIPLDRGGWRVTVHGVQSQTQLSGTHTHTHTHSFKCTETPESRQCPSATHTQMTPAYLGLALHHIQEARKKQQNYSVRVQGGVVETGDHCFLELHDGYTDVLCLD